MFRGRIVVLAALAACNLSDGPAGQNRTPERVARALAGEGNVTTYHNDNARTGAYLVERFLTPANVKTGTFGRLFTQMVDGQVYGQPLYVGGVAVAGKGLHNVVFVATQHNSIYAFDAADDTGGNAQPLWQKSFGPSVPAADLNTGDIPTEVGITGTPVIDDTTDTLYVVTKNKENGIHLQRIHALDITSGNERAGSPKVIEGPGYTQALRAHQRPGLVLYKGVVYAAFSSHGDNNPYHGIVFGFDAKTLDRVASFNVTPSGTRGGIWSGGCAAAVDSTGNMYVTTGNGDFDGVMNYGESVVKLSTACTLSTPAT